MKDRVVGEPLRRPADSTIERVGQIARPALASGVPPILTCSTGSPAPRGHTPTYQIVECPQHDRSVAVDLELRPGRPARGRRVGIGRQEDGGRRLGCDRGGLTPSCRSRIARTSSRVSGFSAGSNPMTKDSRCARRSSGVITWVRARSSAARRAGSVLRAGRPEMSMAGVSSSGSEGEGVVGDAVEEAAARFLPTSCIHTGSSPPDSSREPSSPVVVILRTARPRRRVAPANGPARRPGPMLF